VGNEIDLLLEKGNEQWPVEIKSGQTVSEDFFKGINFWNKLTGTKGGFIVYGGDLIQKRSNGIIVIPYKELDMVKKEAATE
jgi:predicted AAA+ superfamily ATPase